MKKLDKLKALLRKMRSVIVAYSGGADSTFLLAVAACVLGNKVLAVTAVSDTYTAEEDRHSRKMAKLLKAKHKIINTYEFNDKGFIANSENRCYYCKKELFTKLKRLCAKLNYDFVVDASCLDDALDYRPGNKAKKELGVRSPLQEAGFSKQDIQTASRIIGLPTWDKPSLACLASRVPYGIKIDQLILKRIDSAEKFLRKLGLKQVRVRHYNRLCRIEVYKNEIPKLFKAKNQIIDRFKKIGYNYITLDLEGYRTGSMNEILNRNRI